MSHALVRVDKKWTPDDYMAYLADDVSLDSSAMQI